HASRADYSPKRRRCQRRPHYKRVSIIRGISMRPGTGARDSAALAAACAEADLLGETRALLGIIRSYHRIVGRQAPALAIGLGRQLIGGHQMPLQHLKFFAVLETNDVFGMN